MFLRKLTIAMLLVLMAMGMMIVSVSYAEKCLGHVGAKGVDGASNVKKAEDGITGQDNDTPGGRSADIGFVTEVQHAKINGYLASMFNSRIIDVLDVLPSGVIVYAVHGLYENTGVRGHYGIRRNAVYVDASLSDEQKTLIANHEAYELIELLDKWHGHAATIKTDAVKWLNDPQNAYRAREILQKIHDENPYKLEEFSSTLSPGHMILPGIRGAAGNAGVGDVLVSNEADSVLTKNNFFETNTDDAKIITVTADAVINGALDVKDIYNTASQNQMSIAVLVADQAQVEGVTRKFSEAGLSINDLIDKTQIAFVLMRNNIIVAVNQMLEDNKYVLGISTLSNLNAKYADVMGGQI